MRNSGNLVRVEAEKIRIDAQKAASLGRGGKRREIVFLQCLKIMRADARRRGNLANAQAP